MLFLRGLWDRYRVWTLFFLAAFVAFFCFPTSPASWFDEGMYYQIVKNFAAEGIEGIQLAPGQHENLSLISVGYPVLYPAILSFKLFGESIITLRLVALLFLFGFVLSFYLLSKRLHGSSLAFWSTLFLVTFSPLYGNGKNFLGEVPGLFYLFLGLLLLTYLQPCGRGGKWLALSGGVLLGFAASAKPIFLLIIPAVCIAYLFLYFQRRVTTRAERFLPVFAALGVGGSLLIWVVTQFGGSSGLADVSAHYVNPYYAQDIIPLIVSNLKRFFTETTPIHFLLLFWVAGWFLIRKTVRRESISIAEITVLIFSFLIAVSYLRTAGWYRYFFPAHAALFLFLAPGLESAVNRYGAFFLRFGKAALPILFGAIVAIQLIPLKGEALRACAIDAPTAAEFYLNALPKDAAVFFYNLPQVAARYSGKNFYQYMKMSEGLVWGKENEKRMQQGVFDYIFVAHNIPEEISRIPRCYQFERDILQVFIYKRNPAFSCGEK